MGIAGHKFGADAAKALGLEDCRSFTIHAAVDEAPTVESAHFIRSEAGDAFTEVLKRYRLVEIEEPS